MTIGVPAPPRSPEVPSFRHPWDGFLIPFVSATSEHPFVIPQQECEDLAPSKHHEHPGALPCALKPVASPIDSVLPKSFAQALQGNISSSSHDFSLACSADYENPLLPVKKGDYFSVTIDEALYQQRVKLCESSLIGRLILSKGDTPWKLEDLKSRLSHIWSISSPWKMISLGRGYYNFHFDSLLDRDKIWNKGNWIIKPGILRLQTWTPDFNPYKQRSSTAQVWVRIYELSWEYWHPRTLMAIARAAGTPLKMDKNSVDGTFGHFARVLVEVDLSSNLPESVMVERQGHCVFVSLSYERLPDFCTHCNIVGHLVGNCKWAKSHEVAKEMDVNRKSRRSRSRGRPLKVFKAKSADEHKDNKVAPDIDTVVGEHKVEETALGINTDSAGANGMQTDHPSRFSNPNPFEALVLKEYESAPPQVEIATKTLQNIKDSVICPEENAANNSPAPETLVPALVSGSWASEPSDSENEGTSLTIPCLTPISNEQQSKSESLKEKIDNINANSSRILHSEVNVDSERMDRDNLNLERMDGYMPDAMSYAEVGHRLEQIDEQVVGKELVLYVGQDNQASSSDPSSDVLKKKIEEIRSSVINPPPILVASADDNTALKMMSIAARKSWAEFTNEQDLQPSIAALETQDSPKYANMAAKNQTRKSSRNRRPAFKLRL